MQHSVTEAGHCGLQGNGGLQAGMTMDGILARDLQLRPSSKFAYLLRPLPTRAAQLDSYAQYYRRRILRVVSVSKSAKRSAFTCALSATPHLCSGLPVVCFQSWNPQLCLFTCALLYVWELDNGLVH